MTKFGSTRTALIWSAAETFGYQSIQLLVYILLARLVSPEDFGLIAMLAVVFSLGQVLADSGFSNALIQKKDADDLDRSTVFYFNILVGLVLSAVVFLSADWVAEFYGQPKLQPLTRVMCLVILASSIGLIQQAITRKELDFQTRTKSAVIATIGAGGVSLYLASSGAGVWALATYLILMRFLQSALLWFFCEWRPMLAFSLDRLRSMFSFGSKMVVASLISAFFNNLIAIVAGKFYSPPDVGYYDTARRYQEYPAKNLTGIFSRVTFPAFSRIQDDPDKQRSLLKKTLKASSQIVFPVMGLLCGIAHPMFETVLGAKWLPSVPLFQVMCVMGLFQSIAAINLNLLLARGKSGHFLVLELIKRTLAVINVVLTLRFGLFWMVVGMTVAGFLSVFINTFFTTRLLSISSVDQLRIVFKSLILAVVVGAAAFSATHITASAFWNLCSGAIVGTGAGLLFLSVFDRQSLAEYRDLLQGRKAIVSAQ